MLILPPGHQREVRLRRPLTARERWLVRGAVVLSVALIVVAAVSIGSTGKSSRHGCVYASYPGPVGGGNVSECGAAARSLCSSLGKPGGFTGEAARTIAAQCRKAGLSPALSS